MAKVLELKNGNIINSQEFSQNITFAVKRILLELELSIDQMSIDTGIKESTLYAKIRGAHEWQATELLALSMAYGIPIEVFYSDRGEIKRKILDICGYLRKSLVAA